MNRSAEAPISQKLVELANAIHKSELGGLAFKLPWSLLGLLPLLFFVSGAQIWWGRRRSLLRLNQRLKQSGTALAASARR
jgi:uncharacterized iron-regulated membrane protein